MSKLINEYEFRDVEKRTLQTSSATKYLHRSSLIFVSRL